MRPAARMICLGAVFFACGYGAKAQDGTAQAGPPSVAAPSAAAVSSPGPDSLQVGDEVAQWNPVNQDTLDETRGGFDLGNGIVASFGIDRAVYVNGNLVTSTSFNVPDIGHMTTEQANAMAAAVNTVSVIQIGPHNTFDPGSLGNTSGGTVIQNTLDHQNIQTITTLNTTVNTLNAFRQQSLQDTLQQAQLQSLTH